MKHYPPTLAIEPLTKPVCATVTPPGSKSITNRALILAALSSTDAPQTLTGCLRSEDTEVCIAALQQLGYDVTPDWPTSTVVVHRGHRPLIPKPAAKLHVANSGTTMRFLTALLGLGSGRYRLDGVERMRQRPIRDLLDALIQLGVHVRCEEANGYPPVLICGGQWKGGHVRLRADVSSQFLSGLLLAAPFAAVESTTFEVEGPVVSVPYIEMTKRMLHAWHLDAASPKPNLYRVPGNQKGRLRNNAYTVEPDASGASYFFAAAAITGGKVTVPNLTRASLQGDVAFVDVLERMGCVVERSHDAIILEGRWLTGIDVGMSDISDTVMSLAIVALFAEGPTTIRNVAHIRHKETDRLAALATELRRLGATVAEFDDGLTIVPGPLRGATVQTYDDHRMAMSLALVGLRVPGVVIDNPGCVAKTYPDFFTDLESLR